MESELPAVLEHTNLCQKMFLHLQKLIVFFGEFFVFSQLIPCQSPVSTLPVEQFNATTISKHMLLSQVLYTREFLRAAKETL